MTAEALRTCLDEEELEVEERLQRLPAGCPPACRGEARPGLVARATSRGVAGNSRRPYLRNRSGGSPSRSPDVIGDLFPTGHPQEDFVSGARAAGSVRTGCRSGSRRWKVSPRECDDRRSARRNAAHGIERVNRIAQAIQQVAEAREQLPGWFIVEITPRADSWLDDLERHLDAGDNPLLAQRILPPFFDALGFPDAQARKDRLAQRAVQILMKNRRHAQALTILEKSAGGQAEAGRRVLRGNRPIRQSRGGLSGARRAGQGAAMLSLGSGFLLGARAGAENGRPRGPALARMAGGVGRGDRAAAGELQPRYDAVRKETAGGDAGTRLGRATQEAGNEEDGPQKFTD